MHLLSYSQGKLMKQLQLFQSIFGFKRSVIFSLSLPCIMRFQGFFCHVGMNIICTYCIGHIFIFFFTFFIEQNVFKRKIFNGCCRQKA